MKIESRSNASTALPKCVLDDELSDVEVAREDVVELEMVLEPEYELELLPAPEYKLVSPELEGM